MSDDDVYVSKSPGTQRRWHEDPGCDRFTNEPGTRRREIAESWYDPCPYCADPDAQPYAKDDTPRTPGGKSQLERAIDNGEIDPEAFP